MPKAAGLAAEIEAALGVKPRLVPGHGGVFDIVADGRLVFSKHREGRFPAAREVQELLNAREGKE